MTREELFNDLIDDYQGKDRYLRDIVDDIFDIFEEELDKVKRESYIKGSNDCYDAMMNGRQDENNTRN